MTPERRGGLGRGLGALIPTGPGREPGKGLGSGQPATEPGTPPAARFAEIPIDAVAPNPRQPRSTFGEESLAELVSSIREVGLLQPVVVREIGAGRFELVMGERRLRASREAGLVTIPAIVRATSDDAMLRDALLENLHREQLNPLEEAAAYQQLLEDFGATHEELAARIGRSRSQVTNTIRLLHLPASVQRRVAAGVLSAGHARALLGLDQAEAQEQLAARIVAEGMSVRATEEAVHLGVAVTEGNARGSRTASPHSPRTAELAGWLSELFETRVRVDLGRRKGRIIVEFASVDDLERIVSLIDTGAAPSAPGGDPAPAAQDDARD